MSAVTEVTEVTDDQLVVFQLSDQNYALPIQEIQEIIRMTEITPIPSTHFYVTGVINLRGNILPVINLSQRFGLTEKETDQDTRIVVVETKVQNIGMIVDQVLEVGRYQQSEIEPAHTVDSNTEFLTGVVKKDNQLWLLLNTDKVL
ncbi:MAG: chemotaxis protein CheW [Desulfotomaculum sp.]|nr:chemotaxis protein CheW [Desulfotomaculum sp.]